MTGCTDGKTLSQAEKNKPICQAEAQEVQEVRARHSQTPQTASSPSSTTENNPTAGTEAFIHACPQGNKTSLQPGEGAAWQESSNQTGYITHREVSDEENSALSSWSAAVQPVQCHDLSEMSDEPASHQTRSPLPASGRLLTRADLVTGCMLGALSLCAFGAIKLARLKDDAAGDQRALPSGIPDGGVADTAVGGLGGAGGKVSDDPYVVVQNYEGVIYTGKLSVATTFNVSSELGVNTVEVADGSVRVKYSDCHNQICVNAGAIRRPGASIACLPHKLLIEVVNDPANASQMLR